MGSEEVCLAQHILPAPRAKSGGKGGVGQLGGVTRQVLDFG